MPEDLAPYFLSLSHAHVLQIILLGFIGGILSGFIGSGGAFFMPPGMMNLGVTGVVAVGTNITHKFGKAMMGSKKHGETVTVPWGTRDDWVIFVSPRSMGHDEGEKEGDNALLKIQCWASAIANNTTSWKIHARYKFRHASDNGHWSDEYDSYDDASANYLLVPK